MDPQSQSDEYLVQLDNFEGPLDLLLFLIRRDELDITDVPISRLTKDFLDYLKLMKTLRLEIAGEFVLMAATLMRIKARSLLPRPMRDEEDEEDPRADLTRMLLDYKRFKEAAAALSGFESEQSRMYPRGSTEIQRYEGPRAGDYLQDVTLFGLMEAAREAFGRLPEERPAHQIEQIDTTVEERMETLLAEFGAREEYSLTELFEHIDRRIILVITFIALLELMRQRRIVVRQRKQFGELIVRRP